MFSLHHAVLCLTNANINAPLTHFSGFCKIPVDEGARHVINVKCLFFVVVEISQMKEYKPEDQWSYKRSPDI